MLNLAITQLIKEAVGSTPSDLERSRGRTGWVRKQTELGQHVLHYLYYICYSIIELFR